MIGTLTYSVHSTNRTFEEIKEDFECEDTDVEFIGNDEDQIIAHIHVKLIYENLEDAKSIVDIYFVETGGDSEVFSFKDEEGNTLFTE